MLTFLQLVQNLKYRFAVKADSIVQGINRGVREDTDTHELSLVSNLLDFIFAYNESGTYNDEINAKYQEALLKVNNYLGTNLDYKFTA